MNLSFQEKSLWVVFVGLIAASGWYCYTVSESTTPTETADVSSHVLLGFWVLAQLTETGSQLFLYRRRR